MAETTATKLADLILIYAKDRGCEISNLKLQKLLYYCQAWHLAALGSPLFQDRIEAWIHGPVVPSVFGKFKEYRWRTISAPQEIVNMDTGDERWPIANVVEEVMECYGDFTGPQLESLTHSEDPWKIARNGIPIDQPSNAIISHDSMAKFYHPLLMGISE